tara:strand:- start:2447 stop:2689 length:243 start_codon:yes stop_codon:yes gene_type:complete
VDLTNLLVALLIFLAFIVLRRAASYVVLGTMRHLAKKTRTELDDQVVDTIEAPARLVPVVMAFSLRCNTWPLKMWRRRFY